MARKPVADVVDLPLALDEDEAESTNYALRLTEALDAISAAQPVAVAAPVAAAPAAAAAFAQVLATVQAYEPEAEPAAAPAAVALTSIEDPIEDTLTLAELDDLVDSDAEPVAKQPNRVASFLEALDKLPPIKLPIGPAIPWRLGLPMLAALAVVMLVMSRPSASAAADQPGVKLPTQETYSVQQQAPLFAKPAAEQPQAPIGVREPEATNVDVFDIGIKFVAVLGLAFGSLMLLKRFGPGGASAVRSDNNGGVRVMTSVALAPNRTVHVLRTPDGKSLLVGATPNQVNLIADLGELSDDLLTPQGSNFFDVLTSKLAKAA